MLFTLNTSSVINPENLQLLNNKMISILAILTSILVVTSTSTVYSVLWLVATFIITSAYLALTNLGFISLLYVIVYVGAIAILFLFVVQLLDLGAKSELGERSNDYQNTSSISIVLVSILLLLLGFLLIKNRFIFTNFNIISNTHDLLPIFTDFIQNITVISVGGGTPQVQAIAEWLYGPGLLPLIIISVILLVAMIAPIALCKD